MEDAQKNNKSVFITKCADLLQLWKDTSIKWFTWGDESVYECPLIICNHTVYALVLLLPLHRRRSSCDLWNEHFTVTLFQGTESAFSQRCEVIDLQLAETQNDSMRILIDTHTQCSSALENTKKKKNGTQSTRIKHALLFLCPSNIKV